MSLDFFCSIQTVGSDFAIEKIKAWIHPALYLQLSLLLV